MTEPADFPAIELRVIREVFTHLAKLERPERLRVLRYVTEVVKGPCDTIPEPSEFEYRRGIGKEAVNGPG